MFIFFFHKVFPAVPVSVSEGVEHDALKRMAVPVSTKKCPPWCPANEGNPVHDVFPPIGS